MTKRLIIIGAGGHGRVIKDIAYLNNEWQDIYFLDDYKTGKDIIGTSNDISHFLDEFEVIIGIGDNLTRQKIYKKLSLLNIRFATIISKSAYVSPTAIVNHGSVIMPQSIISSHVIIDKCCIINSSSVIEHDSILGKFSHLAPGAIVGGHVKIERNVLVGINSTILPRANIEKNTIIGAGSTLLSQCYSSGKYIGAPAKKI